jgi:hypothetical protein
VVQPLPPLLLKYALETKGEASSWDARRYCQARIAQEYHLIEALVRPDSGEFAESIENVIIESVRNLFAKGVTSALA